jgi:hypothetical protein
MHWDDLKFREQQQPEPLKPSAHVTVWSKRSNHIAEVTEIDATADHGSGMYSVHLPFLRSSEVVEMLNAWETLMKKR